VTDTPARSFDGELTLYPGNGGEDPHDALFWALDERQAAIYARCSWANFWFLNLRARRPAPDRRPTVWRASCPPEAVLAYWRLQDEVEPALLRDVDVHTKGA
jgi:hypothetical protein